MSKKILLVNIDSSWKNIALEKVRLHYERKGFEIEDVDRNFHRTLFYFPNEYDSIWVSCIFDWNKDIAMTWKGDEGTVFIGGSGVDLKTTLPAEIDTMKPKINIGFTTRGCIRNCQFCIVPEKEGHIKVVGDIYDFWDGEAGELILLDNNILAAPEHFFKVTEQIKQNNLKVDFTQGLDHRLLTDAIYERLKSLQHFQYRFAFDDVKSEKSVLRAIELIKRHGHKQAFWYVLVGFDSTIEEDLYRLNILRSNDQAAYVQLYKKDRIYIPIRRWANQHHLFAKMTFREFLLDPRNEDWYREVFKDVLDKSKNID